MRPHHRFTSTADGDLHGASEGVEERRRQIVDLPWTILRQEHGAGVAVVGRPGDHCGTRADAAVTAVAGAALAVRVADCAPVVLRSSGAVGVVHAGWRGLVEGVVGEAVSAMRSLTREPIEALIGPCIRPRCYEFSAPDLDGVAGVLGDGVRSTTATGQPALDVAAAVTAALAAAGITDVVDDAVCTACSPRHWSHRARGDRFRQAAVAWLEP